MKKNTWKIWFFPFFLLLMLGLLSLYGKFGGPGGSPATAAPSEPAAEKETANTAAPGISDWEKEVRSSEPGNTHILYYVSGEGGERTTMLEVRSMTEEHDLDSDGSNEILVYQQDGGLYGIGIYDIIDGKLQYTDVNQALGCDSSEYTGNIGNIKRDYSNAIEAVFKEADGTARDEIYRVNQNQLTYICPLSDALLT